MKNTLPSISSQISSEAVLHPGTRTPESPSALLVVVLDIDHFAHVVLVAQLGSVFQQNVVLFFLDRKSVV